MQAPPQALIRRLRIHRYRSMNRENETPNEDVASATESEAQRVTADQPDTGEAVGAHPPRRQIKIGSQREAAPPGSPQPDAKTPQPDAETAEIPSPTETAEPEPLEEEPEMLFPPPRLSAISDDLQDEIDAAIGDVSLDELLDAQPAELASEDSLAVESRCRATVVKVHRDLVFCSLNGPYEGVASVKQFAEAPAPGTQLDVVVSGYSAEEGLYELTVPGAAVDVGDWSDLVEGLVVEARITGHNKGGLECEVNHIRGFIPASQVSLYRIEDLSQFVEQRLPCVVAEADPQRRNLVLSHRAVLEREKEAAREKLLAELEVGQVREGIVSNVRDFGAFVDLGGVDGLVHVSQLSWDRVGHPSEVLEVGQQIQVKIDKLDKDAGKISLSYRELLENPWTDVETKFSTGSIVSGIVSKIMDFGAFVRLAAGVEGLIHVSELAHQHVARVAQIVSEGQEVQVKVLSVDAENQRISLSLKAVQAPPSADASVDQTESESQDDASEAMPARRSGPQKPLKGGFDRRTGGEDLGAEMVNSAGPFTALARAAVIAPALMPGWMGPTFSTPGPFTALLAAMA